MILLAIEQATPLASLALLRDGSLLQQASWQDTRFHAPQLFDSLPRLLASASVSPADIDVFAVGLGPGSFAGLRAALSAARAMALPGGRRVVGVDSGSAMALDVFCSHDAKRVVIVGDARRGRFWCARFNRRADGFPETSQTYSLISPAELPSRLREGDVLATPDWDRIGGFLRAACPPGATLADHAVHPSACAIGKLALDRMRQDTPLHPLTPLYLHPPVAMAPAPIPRTGTPPSTVGGR